MVWTCNPAEIVTGGPLGSLSSQVCPRSQWETVSKIKVSGSPWWRSGLTFGLHTQVSEYPPPPTAQLHSHKKAEKPYYNKNYWKGKGVRKIWSFSCELKKTFLAKEVTEAREDQAVHEAFCPGFLPQPILEFMSELWIWTASSVAWWAWLKAELCRIIWHYVSERKQINTAFAKRQLQNLKGFHGYTGDRAREAGRLGNEDRKTETSGEGSWREEGKVGGWKGRRQKKNDHLGRQKIKKNF